MPYITATPAAGIFPAAVNPVLSTTDPSVSKVYYTTDGSAPVLAKYVAYDTIVPPNPFIAVVQDGAGNVAFDGGFPKFYNGSMNASAQKYFINVLNWIADKAKVSAGNKKVLILGDAIAADNYAINNTTSIGFSVALSTLSTASGFPFTKLDSSNFAGGVIDIPYATLDQYCAIIVFSTRYSAATANSVTAATINNMITYRQGGGGIFFITDHGTVADPKASNNWEGFYNFANRFTVPMCNAYFGGNYDRTPVGVGFLRTTYGNHPFWASLADTDTIPAGGSESRVYVTSLPSYTLPTTVSLSGTGYKSIAVLVEKTDGTVSVEKFGYGFGVASPFGWLTAGGAALTPTTKSILNIVPTKPSWNLSGITTPQGLMLLDSDVFGEFSRPSATVVENYYANETGIPHMFYGSDSTTKHKMVLSGQQLTLQLQSPLSYSTSITVDRPSVSTVDAAMTVAQLNAIHARDEGAGVERMPRNGSNAFIDFNWVLNNPNRFSTAEWAKDVRTYTANQPIVWPSTEGTKLPVYDLVANPSWPATTDNASAKYVWPTNHNPSASEGVANETVYMEALVTVSGTGLQPLDISLWGDDMMDLFIDHRWIVRSTMSRIVHRVSVPPGTHRIGFLCANGGVPGHTAYAAPSVNNPAAIRCWITQVATGTTIFNTSAASTYSYAINNPYIAITGTTAAKTSSTSITVSFSLTMASSYQINMHDGTSFLPPVNGYGTVGLNSVLISGLTTGKTYTAYVNHWTPIYTMPALRNFSGGNTIQTNAVTL